MLYSEFSAIILIFSACFVSYWLRPWRKIQTLFLILLSFGVISTWGTHSLVIFLIACLLNYFASVAIAKWERRRKLLLWFAIGANLVLLLFFKYAKFLNEVIGIKLLPLPTEHSLVIPLGVSFYTFHSISYLIDLSRRQTKLLSPLEFTFYLSFFPHVIAGPIVRTWQIVNQLHSDDRQRFNLVSGARYLIMGFLLKGVCADTIGPIIDPYFAATPPPLSVAGHWIVAIAYYFQIYGDFAGYSLIAMGISRWLGFHLPTNFRAPMLALNIRDFWRRWHITLSRWLRDYLYIPLGGSRNGLKITMMSLFVTMVLGGFWHGAAWTFIAWGAMHGIALVLDRCTIQWQRDISKLGLIIIWAFTQGWIILAWVLFRSPDLKTASYFMMGMFSKQSTNVSSELPVGILLMTFIPILLHQMAPIFWRKIAMPIRSAMNGAFSSLWLVLNVMIFVPTRSFIYFIF